MAGRRKYVRSNRTLKRLYNEYNRKYFSGRLPDALVTFTTPAEMKRSGLAKHTCAVTCFNPGLRPAIFISRTKHKTWGYIKSDLLHECCHVARPRANHGKVFQQEMLRIAKLGAFRDIW
jgi:hypothetical protein